MKLGPITSPRPLERLAGYAAALLAVAAATALAATVDRFSEGANLAMIFLLGVLVTALACGLGPALAAAGASVLAYNFFFLSPRFTFEIGHAADAFTFAVFMAVAAVTGWLAGRARDQGRLAARRAATVGVLLDASRRLSATDDRAEAAQALAEQLAEACAGATVVFVPSERGGLALVAGAPTLPLLPPAALAAARQVWADGDPHAESGWRFRALEGVQSRAGVAGLAPSGRRAEDEDEALIGGLIEQGAVALERAELSTVNADARVMRRSDRLRTALLNSISHDLRTPLAAILGSATTLLDYGEGLERRVRHDLLDSIREEAERLNRYVGDLLDMTRLEGGALAPRNDWVDPREVIAAAIARVSPRLGDRTLVKAFPAELSLVKADAALLEQALVNLLENALAYTPADAAIEAAAVEDRAHVVLSIEDDGPGVAADQLDRVFDRARRADQPSDRIKGTGLGLAIAKGFVEAMGGRIAVSSPVRDGHGSRFLISLPKQVATHEYLL